MSTYPAIVNQPTGMLDLFSPTGRVARRGQRQIEKSVINNMVALATFEDRSATRARATFSGARRSMELGHRLTEEAGGDPMALAIAAEYLARHVTADIDDLEHLVRNL